MATPDFSKIFASNSPLAAYNFSDADYLTGWNFIGSTPPARTMFDAWMRQSDTKMKWLHDNALYDSSLEDVLFWRMPSTTYAVGARRCLRNGPLGAYLLCITAGTTDTNVLATLPTGTEVGNTFTDGTVTWQVMQHASTAALSEHVSANDAHAALFAKTQPLNANLSALAGMKMAADKLIYTDGPDSFALATLTEFARSLLTTASASAARETLGAAPLSSPDFLGTPTAPTPAVGTKTTQIATTAFVAAAVTALVNSSPAALDTLKELADALGDDPNFATTMTNALAGKLGTNQNAVSASKWATARILTLTGNTTGSAAIDGSGNVSMSTTTNYAASAGNSDTVDGWHLQSILDRISASNTGIVAQSLGTNGYAKFAGGLILQWGIGTYSVDTWTKYNFPISFANECLSYSVSIRTPSDSTYNSAASPVTVRSVSKSDIELAIYGGSGSVGWRFSYIAVGY